MDKICKICEYCEEEKCGKGRWCKYCEKVASLIAEERNKVAKNALIIAEYWLEEDGRSKHLIQDLWDVEDISVLHHIDEKYIKMHRPELLKKGTHE